MCMLYILHQGKFWKALYYAKMPFLKQERARTAVELGWCREGRGKGKGGKVLREQLQKMPVCYALLRVFIIFLCIDCKDKWIFLLLTL